MDEEQMNQMLRYFEQYVIGTAGIGKAIREIADAMKNREDSQALHLLPQMKYVREVAPGIAAHIIEASPTAAAKKAVAIAKEIHRLTSPDLED
mgnify:CR=1 FL=1